MHQLFRRLSASAAIVGAALSPQAFALTVIDFESPALSPIYFPTESFSQDGFDFRVVGDAALIATFDATDPTSPSASSGKFYQQLNEGYMVMTRRLGGSFDLNGFSAAFVPLSPASSQTTAILVEGVDVDFNIRGLAYLFPSASGGRYPFGIYNDPLDFSDMTQLLAVKFSVCPVVNGGLSCDTPLQNNGQFALDDILVTTPVPEPTAAAMLALGLLGLALLAKRRAA